MKDMPDVLYHNSPRRNRESIERTGLGVEFDQGEGYTEPGVYFSGRPIASTTEDTFEVDVSGLDVHPDPLSDEWSGQGGSFYVAADVPSERVRRVDPTTIDPMGSDAVRRDFTINALYRDGTPQKKR